MIEARFGNDYLKTAILFLKLFFRFKKVGCGFTVMFQVRVSEV